MDTQTLEVVDDHLRRSRETLNDLISRRRQLAAELDLIIAEREDAHFAALIGHDHATLQRLITLNRKISDLRDEHAVYRAEIAAVMADLEG